MKKIKIVAIDGSARADSASRKIVYSMEKTFLASGVHFSICDHLNNKLPLFDDSTEGHANSAVKALLEAVSRADGLIFCSPEYHNSMSAVMKNALDWMSALPSRLNGKVVGLAGGGGGMGNSGATIQMMMATRSMGAWTMPLFLGVPNVWDAFDGSGDLQDPALAKRMEQFVTKFIKFSKHFAENQLIFRN